MSNWLGKLFGFRTTAADLKRLDPSNLDSTLEAAAAWSTHRENCNDVIVLVELGSEFDYGNGTFVRQRYNFYTYRGRRDFNEISNLKAAYVNGRRVDTVNQANSGRVVQHQAAPAAEALYLMPSIADGDPLAVGGRRRYTTVCAPIPELTDADKNERKAA